MPHYFSEWQDSELRTKRIKEKIRGVFLEFFLSAGVFSSKKVDYGSRLLAEYSLIKKGWKVLDLGCGAGIIGIVIAKVFPDSDVLMIDLNRRAVKIAEMNIKLNNLSNCKAKYSNLFSKVNEKFDAILVNPPMSAGKSVCFEIIEKSKDFLNDKGLLQLVARHNKGGSSLKKKMEEVFGNASEIVKRGGYRVYISRKHIRAVLNALHLYKNL